ncbi:hypothetical protein [Lacticaseibacillus suibinensis]|uniref:hypothetical protein n=1 Tax=Lacticaseibacillus suibinensis TaxID=2486011 RepID=UPI001CDD31E5|nr:hypothetical protein [Lacticaseibacillus suibinensis]
MNLHEQFKGGFTRGSGIRTEEILHDDRVTNEHVLQFLMYDANLYPCPNLSTWKPKARQAVIDLTFLCYTIIFLLYEVLDKLEERQ